MRRPNVLPSIISLLAFVFLLSLGNWQMDRLKWKQALMAKVETRLQAAEISLPPASSWVTLAQKDYDYHAVRLSGRFDHSQEIYWYAGAFQGRTGVQVITPFALEAGGVVLVNRGFVADSVRDPALRAQGQIDGLVTLTGLIRWPSARNQFDAPDAPDQRLWFVKDLESMTTHLDLDAAPFFVELDVISSVIGGPVGGQTRISFSNRHLEYALTWYGLAVTLVIIFILWQVLPSRRNTQGDDTSPMDG